MAGHVRMLGDTDGLAGGDDRLVVDHMTHLVTSRDRFGDGANSAIVRDSIDMDGRGGTDTYEVLTHGSAVATPHDYIVNALDTGGKADGLDTLTIDGGNDADIFLLRRVEALTEGQSVPVSANTPAFVALLHGTLADVRNQVRAGCGTHQLRREHQLAPDRAQLRRRRLLCRRRQRGPDHARWRCRQRRNADRPDVWLAAHLSVVGRRSGTGQSGRRLRHGRNHGRLPQPRRHLRADRLRRHRQRPVHRLQQQGRSTAGRQ
ncbi:hypothetical protein LP419_39735 [Massilia sp. H-1]|nr:hypothetical protein LP419_39735 [Massilia sp. H-1]